ncbi:MAG: NYN domain-containing protein [Thermoplasmatota archaeon]
MATKTVFLVDGANIEISAREVGAPKIDYGKFKDVLLKELKTIMKNRDITLVRPYYYDSWDGSKDRKRFFDNLESQGYDLQGVLRTEPLEKGTRSQKGVDIKMAVDMVHFSDATPVDIIVVCSGDMDFLPAVEIAKYSLKRVVVATFKHSGSEELIRSADDHIDLTPLIKKFKS